MGYGFPGGVGAKIGNPDKPVIVISGDGGMQMNIPGICHSCSRRASTDPLCI